ncbi:MAG: preprotein translocase subunit SecY [Acidimicrobiia bacterium]|nr:preprotein translocase subunit SecY [Acidimicrobiia bacterium]
MLNMFRVPDLRNKIIFTMGIVLLFRVGSFIPAPGIDLNAVEQLKQNAERGGILGLLQLFSGGALTQFAIFALGIMPYITSSIILQILGVVVPKIEQLQKQGAVGQRKINQYTRYLTVVIALLQSTGLVFLFHNGGGSLIGDSQQQFDLVPTFTVGRVLMIVATITAGTALIMWMGELITQRGIGNGMSIIVFTSVVSVLPAQGGQIRAEGGYVKLGIVIALFMALLVAIVIVEQGQRRIPVQFPKRVVGRRMFGGQSTYIPLKVNQSGVIPVIFASSVLYLPVLLTNLLPAEGWGDTVRRFVNDHLVNHTSFVYLGFYGLLIIGFAYFYTAISFDPVQRADDIRKQGGFIPGIRPGPQTERHLQKIVSRITLPGALFIAGVALLPPLFISSALDVGSNNTQQLAFGGVSVLIAVGVALETMKQIDSQLMMRNYEGFLK